jgi:competence protein ComEC
VEVGRIYQGGDLRIGGATACTPGAGWVADAVEFRFLTPPGSPTLSENDRSCVLSVTAGRDRLLLPADIERRAERALLRSARTALKADILVAPHHGSRSSSTPDFIAAVGARYVLYPVGYRNRFRFPRPGVVQRYRNSGAVEFATDRHGAISFDLGAGGPLQPHWQRAANPRFWQDRY